MGSQSALLLDLRLAACPGWLYPTEIQPLETRAAGASLNTASNMICEPAAAVLLPAA